MLCAKKMATQYTDLKTVICVAGNLWLSEKSSWPKTLFLSLKP
jgi:hypothetical protein